LPGRWTVVGGASEGLGAAIAERAAWYGSNILAVARRGDRLQETKRRIVERSPVAVRTLTLDLGEAGAAETLASEAADLDVGLFVHNAATAPRGTLTENQDAEVRHAIAVNCTTPTLLCRFFAERMRTARVGAIVLISSIGGYVGMNGFGVYSATKAYEIVLAEALWSELQPYDVRALAYVVGATATPIHLRSAPQTDEWGDTTEEHSLSDALGMRLARPDRPTDVADRLFSVVDDGPVAFANAADEQIARQLLTLDRRAITEQYAQFTKKAFAV
jgi:short-subunit dehydrogenase